MDKRKAKLLARASVARGKYLAGCSMLWSMSVFVVLLAVFNIFAGVTNIVPMVPTTTHQAGIIIGIAIACSVVVGAIFGGIGWATGGVLPDIGTWQCVGLIILAMAPLYAGMAGWRWCYSEATGLESIERLFAAILFAGIGFAILGRAREIGIELFQE